MVPNAWEFEEAVLTGTVLLLSTVGGQKDELAAVLLWVFMASMKMCLLVLSLCPVVVGFNEFA